MFHLDQQVQPFLKWIQGNTKSPANRINKISRVDLVDATLKPFQEILNTPFLYYRSAWHLQLARASMLHLDQQVQLSIKWIWGRKKSPANRINLPTSVKLTDVRPPGLASGPTGTVDSKVDLGEDQSPCQKDQRTYDR